MDEAEALCLEKEIVGFIDFEKDRLGRDLHDGLCQTLSGISALAAALSRRLETNCEAAAAAEISQLLQLAIREAHQLARGLHPPELNGCGLIRTLAAFAATVRSQFRVSCAFRCNLPQIKMAADVELQLYRIVQESVSNAIRHGKARRVIIILHFADATGTLTVKDNGNGIQANACEGTGMQSMAYRARLIGASLEVQADPRRGTRVQCVFRLPPCPPETASDV